MAFSPFFVNGERKSVTVTLKFLYKNHMSFPVGYTVLFSQRLTFFRGHGGASRPAEGYCTA